MGNLSKSDLGIIIAFVVIAVAGGVGWWFTADMAASAKSEMNNAHRKLTAINRERYTPSQQNITVLEENAAKLDSAIDPIITAKLDPEGSPLDGIKAMNPVSWKTDQLLETLRRLRDKAKSDGVTLPPDYYFSFGQYRGQDPSQSATEILGKQLYGIERMVTILLEAGGPPTVRAINSVRRSFDEYGPYKPEARSSTSSSDERILRNVETVGDLYRTYPFEISFSGNTEGLRRFLDGLAAAPTVFVVRAVSVDNSKPISPTRAEIEAMINRGKAPASSPAGFGFAEEQRDLAPAVGPQPVFGSEYLNVRVRLDMIEWLDADDIAAEKPADDQAPASGATRNRRAS